MTDEPAPRKEVSAIARLAGRLMAERRKSLGVTQQELADAAGLTRSSVANLEAGRQEMSLATAKAVSRRLNLTMGELFGEVAPVVVPATLITQGWIVDCAACGPVGAKSLYEQARALRTEHVDHVHLGVRRG